MVIADAYNNPKSPTCQPPRVLAAATQGYSRRVPARARRIHAAQVRLRGLARLREGTPDACNRRGRARVHPQRVPAASPQGRARVLPTRVLAAATQGYSRRVPACTCRGPCFPGNTPRKGNPAASTLVTAASPFVRFCSAPPIFFGKKNHPAPLRTHPRLGILVSFGCQKGRLILSRSRPPHRGQTTFMNCSCNH